MRPRSRELQHIASYGRNGSTHHPREPVKHSITIRPSY